jgi:arginine-tRNA-protein transferase
MEIATWHEGLPVSASIHEQLKELSFYISRPHECSYLPDRQAITLFAEPTVQIDTNLYSVLINYGFRRSGELIYRPRCPSCDACVPVRVDVEAFQPNRSQRRCWQTNQDLEVRRLPARYRESQYQLYQRYVKTRHAGGGMDDAEPDRYMEFLHSPSIETVFVEFSRHGLPLCVAVIDVLATGLSSVYTFFEPEQSRRSLGTYAVLWTIDWARQLGLAHVYLGYWIKDCRKMDYKRQFQPLQGLQNGTWQWLENS